MSIKLASHIKHMTVMLFAGYDENGNVVEHVWAWNQKDAETRIMARNPNVAWIQRIR